LLNAITARRCARLDAEEGVSPATAAALRAAMNRLFAGKPQRTDGRLVKENLRREADVSHATMHRARKVMTEWDDLKAARGGVTVGEARRDDEIDKLKTRLAEKTRECIRLQGVLDVEHVVHGVQHVHAVGPAEPVQPRDRRDGREGAGSDDQLVVLVGVAAVGDGVRVRLDAGDPAL
jgi:hypothetical protein